MTVLGVVATVWYHANLKNRRYVPKVTARLGDRAHRGYNQGSDGEMVFGRLNDILAWSARTRARGSRALSSCRSGKALGQILLSGSLIEDHR